MIYPAAVFRVSCGVATVMRQETHGAKLSNGDRRCVVRMHAVTLNQTGWGRLLDGAAALSGRDILEGLCVVHSMLSVAPVSIGSACSRQTLIRIWEVDP
jgi:hypothetical protein